ncbi:hypothetical protein Plhal304r1_c010g0038781 [Plasmopara halstedii]
MNLFKVFKIAGKNTPSCHHYRNLLYNLFEDTVHSGYSKDGTTIQEMLEPELAQKYVLYLQKVLNVFNETEK